MYPIVIASETWQSKPNLPHHLSLMTNKLLSPTKMMAGLAILA